MNERLIAELNYLMLTQQPLLQEAFWKAMPTAARTASTPESSTTHRAISVRGDRRDSDPRTGAVPSSYLPRECGEALNGTFCVDSESDVGLPSGHIVRARPEAKVGVTCRGPLRVLIAGDHDEYRRQLRETLERQSDILVVAVASNGLDAVQRVSNLRPDGLDLVLMDMNMPVLDGIRATREIAARDPSLPIIILTVSTLDRDLFAGIDSGAIGLLSKNLSPASLIRTLRDFWSNGSLPMSRTMAAKAIAYLQQRRSQSFVTSTPAPENLTTREHQILTCVASGAHDREIAATLFVAETTIKTHIRHILRKLGARNRAEAVARMRDGDLG